MGTKNITEKSGGPRVKKLQHGIRKTLKGNGFGKWAQSVTVDGNPGPMTFKMARLAGSMQGLSEEQLKRIRNHQITPYIEEILTHERARNEAMKRRAKKRDKRFDKIRHDLKHPPFDKDGISEWHGEAVPSWLVGEAKGPDGRVVHWLDKLADAGWDSQINSGCRTPEHSEALCFGICGAPSCSGTCAGRSSNHVVEGPSDWGALDVQQYNTFNDCCRRTGCPLQNALGAADPWHFSPSGR
jgi:hypothetical protein